MRISAIPPPPPPPPPTPALEACSEEIVARNSRSAHPEYSAVRHFLTARKQNHRPLTWFIRDLPNHKINGTPNWIR